MFKRLIGAFAKSKAETEVEHGLQLVQARWLAYRALNPKPSEEQVVSFTGPFIAPTLEALASDPKWGHKPQSAMLDLIFVVLLADAQTNVGETKLRAMRDLLGRGE